MTDGSIQNSVCICEGILIYFIAISVIKVKFHIALFLFVEKVIFKLKYDVLRHLVN